jgi:hypothetical protein
MFHSMFDKLVTQFGAEALGILPLYRVYRRQLDDELLALDLIRFSVLTKKIAAAGRLRSRLFRGLALHVQSYLCHFDDARCAAAQRLDGILRHYGNIARRRLEDASAAISDLCRELRREENLAAVAALGLGEWLECLDRENRALEAMVLKRYGETAHRPQVNMKEIRRDVDRTYRRIISLLEARVHVGGAPVDRGFIGEVNAMTSHFREQLAQESGRRHPVKDLGQGGHTVVEPLGVLPYTGRAVTPIPAVCYCGDGQPGVALAFARDFTLAYKNNVREGTATVIIRGAGDYRGQTTVTFTLAVES